MTEILSMRIVKPLLFGFVLLAVTVTAAAQPATCTPLVETALQALNENCSEVARNQACYGYDRLTTTFTDIDVDPEEFSQPADITALNTLASLQTAPLDEANDEWGVALMQVQANLPATLPGQNVIFVVMGDAQIQVDETVDGAAPMQAFYFTTGIGNPNCNESPDTLIIQSPGGERVELTVNGAEISLASTAFMTLVEDAEGETAFELTMAEGEAVINGDMIVPEGHWARIPLDTENPVEGSFFEATDETPFCRETPEMHRVDFEAILGAIPVSALAVPVDEIEPDERGCHTIHVVQAGENLFRIGLQYDVPWQEIEAANNLANGRQISVGQELIIPLDAQ
jgi:hypothetical protein